MSSLARPVAVVGVGYSELSRKGEPNPNALALTAARAALSDAGLASADVDGIFEYKFGPESPGAQDMARLLGVPDLAAFADIMATNPSGLASALAGVMAVASGACETVLVFRCLTRSAGHQGGVATGPETVHGRDQFLTPYGYLGGILVNLALKKQRWIAEYDRPEDDFGHIAVNARRWAALNPRAVLREEITMADYLSSRMVVDPLRVLDCDYPVNGAVATVSWIEAMGACGRGEFGVWVGDGSRLGPGGDFPLNTAGGQLAEGRLHGIGFLNEAVLQLRGQSGERQVPGAEVALVASGVYPQCGAMVLARE